MAAAPASRGTAPTPALIKSRRFIMDGLYPQYSAVQWSYALTWIVEEANFSVSENSGIRVALAYLDAFETAGERLVLIREETRPATFVPACRLSRL